MENQEGQAQKRQSAQTVPQQDFQIEVPQQLHRQRARQARRDQGEQQQARRTAEQRAGIQGEGDDRVQKLLRDDLEPSQPEHEAVDQHQRADEDARGQERGEQKARDVCGRELAAQREPHQAENQIAQGCRQTVRGQNMQENGPRQGKIRIQLLPLCGLV